MTDGENVSTVPGLSSELLRVDAKEKIKAYLYMLLTISKLLASYQSGTAPLKEPLGRTLCTWFL